VLIGEARVVQGQTRCSQKTIISVANDGSSFAGGAGGLCLRGEKDWPTANNKHGQSSCSLRRRIQLTILELGTATDSVPLASGLGSLGATIMNLGSLGE